MSRPRPSLTVIGDVNVDITMGTLGDWPAIGTETVMDTHDLRPGGSAGNSALAMQYLGSDCTLISLVGDNHFGNWLVGCFEHCDARFSFCDAPTTLSVCLSHSCSERTIFTTRGHLERMDRSHALNGLEPARSPGDTALLTGAFLLPLLRAEYGVLLREIRAAGYEIAIDTGWPSGGWTPENRAEVLEWIPHCTHLLINESEATGLAGLADPAAAAEHIYRHMAESSCLVIKQGKRGATALRGGELVRTAAQAVEVRDSIGAGDTFNAAYLDAWLHGADLEAALETGCMLASTVISRRSRSAIATGEMSGIAYRAAFPGETTMRMEK
jgi:ribokinase